MAVISIKIIQGIGRRAINSLGDYTMNSFQVLSPQNTEDKWNISFNDVTDDFIALGVRYGQVRNHIMNLTNHLEVSANLDTGPDTDTELVIDLILRDL